MAKVPRPGNRSFAPNQNLNPKLGHLEIVEWVDHASLAGNHWQTIETVATLTPEHVTSIGWVLKEEKEFIVLMPHHTREMGFGDVAILKRAITKRKRIRVT
jgi:hypothetical protein